MLPTSSGKPLCYSALPYVFDSLRGENRASIVLVVSPLQAIMEDQVKKYTARGLHVAFLVKAHRDERVRVGVVHGDYQLVYMSSKAMLLNLRCYVQFHESMYYYRNVIVAVAKTSY